MTGHIHTIPQSEHKPQARSFSSWLNSQASLLVSHLLGIFSIGVLITSLIYYSLDTSDKLAEYLTPSFLQAIIFYAHITFILYCIVYLILILDDNNKEPNRVLKTHKRIFGGNPENSESTLEKSQRLLKEFKFYFLLFWLSMLALYLTFSFIGYIKQKDETENIVATFPASPEKKLLVEGTITQKGEVIKDGEKPRIEKIEVTESNIDVVRVPDGGPKDITTPVTENKNDFAPYTQKTFSTRYWEEAFVHVLPDFLTFALNTVSLAFVFWCMSILYLPYQTIKEKSQQRKLIYFSSVSIFFLVVSFPLMLEAARSAKGLFIDSTLLGYTTVFNAISGTVNAVVVALLIARLDSKLIGLPSKLVSVLYLYAAVQPLFVVFSQPGLVNEAIKTVVLLFVFVLKIYFFLIIVYAMQTGRMLNYLFCFPTLNRRVNSMFDDRFEITTRKEDGTYDFIITQKHHIIYETDKRFDTQDECVAAIERLIRLDENSYHVRQSGDAFIVEIIDDNSYHSGDARIIETSKVRYTFCHSVAKRSRKEAEALKRESMENIPFSRLNTLPEQ